MQFYVISQDIYTNLYNLPQMFLEIIGSLPGVSNNNKLLAKFHPGTLRIMDTMQGFP